MRLPEDVIAAHKRMNRAQAELLDHAEKSGERDSDEDRRLVENLQDAIREYEHRIAAFLRDTAARQ